MQIPIQIARGGDGPLQAQIVDGVRALILAGSLKPGSQIPSTRQLADQLRVSRNTVLLAYTRLTVEGYIETRSGRTLVREEMARRCPTKPSPASRPKVPTVDAPRSPVLFEGCAPPLFSTRRKPLFDFFVGRPSTHAFPLKTWRRLYLSALSTAGSSLTEYRHPAGMLELRHAIAEHLGAARGMNVTAAQVVIVNGIQEALNIVARLLVKPGTPVAVENPCYQGASNTFASHGARLLPVSVDENGVKTDLLPEHSVSLIYVTPSHQFPTGATLPVERRFELLEWARRVGAYIVEDDYDSDFRYDGPPLTALAGLDTSRVVLYLGTFSKSLGAGIRVGYMVVPLELAEAATSVKALLNAGNSWLDQVVLSELIRTGSYERHLQRIRFAYRNKRNRLVQALRRHFGDDVRVTGDQGGMHVMWQLPDSLPDAKTFEALALTQGVGVYSLRSAVTEDFGGGPYSHRSLVLGYPALEEVQIEEAVSRLSRCVANGP